jgi:hypothetical protein
VLRAVRGGADEGNAGVAATGILAVFPKPEEETMIAEREADVTPELTVDDLWPALEPILPGTAAPVDADGWSRRAEELVSSDWPAQSYAHAVASGNLAAR